MWEFSFNFWYFITLWKKSYFILFTRSVPYCPIFDYEDALLCPDILYKEVKEVTAQNIGRCDYFAKRISRILLRRCLSLKRGNLYTLFSIETHWRR